MNAAPILQAREALRLVNDDYAKTVPTPIWIQCMKAFVELDMAVRAERIELPVEQRAQVAA